MNARTSKMINSASVVFGIPVRALKRAWNGSNRRGKAMYKQRWTEEIRSSSGQEKLRVHASNQANELAEQQQIAKDGRAAGSAALDKMLDVAARNRENDA